MALAMKEYPMQLDTDSRDELTAIRDWFDYNTFVREKYMTLLSSLKPEILNKDRGASFPSVLDIHVHILDVIKSWFHVYETGQDLPEIKGLGIEAVRKLENEVDDYVAEFMSNLDKKKLYGTFRFSSGENLVERQLSEMLWHLVEEELQHRGEMNALLWQENIDPPITSWSKWKRRNDSSG
jgi:uncharacterized damage-inducible protein DinB